MKEFLLQGRRISFEQNGDADEFRVLVEGAAVPITFIETESTTTNSDTYYKELSPRAPAEWIPIGACIAAREPFESSDARGRPYASCAWRTGGVESSGIALLAIDQLSMLFALDFSSVEIALNHHTDLSP
jgi:hypothetical protein